MARKKTYDKLFKAEQDTLLGALDDIADEQYSGNELLPRYQALADDYQKLLKTTRKIFHISDSQGQVLQQHQGEIQNLLDNANQGFLTFGKDLKVNARYSAECIRIFGGKIAGMSIPLLLGQGVYSPDKIAEVLDCVFSSGEGSGYAALQQLPAVFHIRDKDVRVECKLIAQETAGASESMVVMMIITDITEQLRAEAQIRFLSYHDKLTSLYNRAYVETVAADLEKSECLPLSVIMVDMNVLKLVNDVFGHQQGDMLLVAMAEVLEKSCRGTDIIVRWGGDEFLIVLPKTDYSDALKVCERIRRACGEAADHPIPLSAAIGSATKDKGTVRLSELFSAAENQMYNDKLIRSREVKTGIVACLVDMQRRRCFANEGHDVRVKELGGDFVLYLGLDSEAAEIKLLPQLAMLHDIGKIAIPGEILGKPGPLTPKEWEVVKSHSDVGYRMVQAIAEPALADIILALHERWDGTGYPYGLKAGQIPLLARIFSLVDVYDVITHDRPYRAALDNKAALREIQAGSGSCFDPELTRRFITFMSRRDDK